MIRSNSSPAVLTYSDDEDLLSLWDALSLSSAPATLQSFSSSALLSSPSRASSISSCSSGSSFEAAERRSPPILRVIIPFSPSLPAMVPTVFPAVSPQVSRRDSCHVTGHMFRPRKRSYKVVHTVFYPLFLAFGPKTRTCESCGDDVRISR